MKKMIIILLLFMLTGCNQNTPITCDEDFCINAELYDIDGTLTLKSINRDTVSFETIINDEDHKIRSLSLSIYDDDLSVIGSVNGRVEFSPSYTQTMVYRALDPNESYTAVLFSTIIEDGKSKSIIVATSEFSTEDFTQLTPTGTIDNFRIGDSYIIYDLELDSQDYEIISYGVFLYIGDEKVDEFTAWGGKNLTTVSSDNLVFSDLTSTTTYTIRFSVIYESSRNQSGIILFENLFTTA